MKEHKKHADMVKPAGGLFHRNEIAILGAPCGIIKRLAEEVAEAVQISVGYVDADHGASEEKLSPFTYLYTDKISFHQTRWLDPTPDYRFRKIFHDVDALLVNGNHFKAAAQVVIVNAKKAESLQRKLDRLTNVQLVILDKGMEAPFDYLQEKIAGVPVFSIEDTAGISNFFEEFWGARTPVLKGLALAGGQSLRMGRDKGEIDYHGKPQREFVSDLLSEFCDEVFISSRLPDQFESSYPLIPDTFAGLGPFGGILSAFRSDPNAAWFTVACDLPLMNSDVLSALVAQRDVSKVATCFHNPDTGFPEPLITIWEPRAYFSLLEFLALGYSCPRKALINSNVAEVELPSLECIENVNTPEELAQVKAKLNE